MTDENTNESTEETFDPEFVQNEIIPKLMSDSTYDILKWVAQYIIPGIGLLYAILAGIWSLPYGNEVVGTIFALDFVLGIVLGISTNQYNKYLASIKK